MASKAPRRISPRFFWPIFVAVLAAALFTVLWSGQREIGSYGDMACTFEELAPGCMDSVEEWNRGLVFYDSSLSVNGDTLSALKKLLWEYWNIEFAGAGEPSISKESILPLQVLKNRKSGCMGLSWLAMMVAEARGISLRVILLPGHVFLRYGCEEANATSCVNLEPNRRGFSYTDDEYREKYRDGRWTDLDFKPLSSRQFMGLAAFNIGNLYLDSEPRRALTWYRMAEDFFKEYPGITVNQNIAKNKLPDSL